MGRVVIALIMEGPIERICQEVRQRIAQLGRDGGYFCSADQGMPFPAEHVNAYRQAMVEFGRYPLPPRHKVVVISDSLTNDEPDN